MSKLKMFALATVAVLGLTGSASAATAISARSAAGDGDYVAADAEHAGTHEHDRRADR